MTAERDGRSVSPRVPLRVLLVEDTGSDALLVRGTLERAGVPVELEVVARAEAALDRLVAGKRESAVDVLVTDHRLPGMNGLELCREVLDRGLEVGTVLLTGVGSEDLAVQALKAGVDEYLIKDGRGGYLSLFAAVLFEVDRRCRERVAHRRAEERARHLAAIVESSGDAIVGLDLEQRIVSWNPAAVRLFGWSEEEAVGRPAAILLPSDHGDEMPRIVERVLAGERLEHYETLRKRQDGSIVEVSLTVSPIRGTGGEVVGSSAIFRDLTAQRRAEASRRRSHRELETFLHGVTHALRPPLVSARGVLDLLREESPGEDLAAYLDRLGGSLGDMAQLVDGLAELARLDHEDPAPRSIDLGAAVAAAVERLCPEGRARGRGGREIRVSVGNALPRARADTDRLRQAVTYLLDNAVRYASVEVEILAWVDLAAPESVGVTVRDDGPGIPRGEQARIFEPFYRRVRAVDEAPGPGLGLTLARRAVESMGGALRVDSEVGRGAAFHVLLPKA